MSARQHSTKRIHRINGWSCFWYDQHVEFVRLMIEVLHPKLRGIAPPPHESLLIRALGGINEESLPES